MSEELSKAAANDNHPSPTTPLRLADALKYAYPFGGMTVSGLRREATRGRLVIERTAGKDFTTLSDIEEMREQCRVKAEAHTYISNQSAGRRMARSKSAPTGSSATVATQSAAQAALLAKLQTRKSA